MPSIAFAVTQHGAIEDDQDFVWSFILAVLRRLTIASLASTARGAAPRLKLIHEKTSAGPATFLARSPVEGSKATLRYPSRYATVERR